jgi:lysophospholipase L1-like esterase
MRRWVVVTVVALLASGCFTDHRPDVAPAAVRLPRSVYVAVGASESVGVGADNPVRDAWPQVLFRTSMPANTVFYDVAQSGARVGDAVTRQLPAALALEPTVVTVWLNVDDMASGESPTAYESGLHTLVRALRRGGVTKVLVADTPPLDALPAVARLRLPGATVEATVQRYNEVIARVCEEEGATLVHLHDAGVAALADGTYASLVSGDGFHPSTAGHAAVAKAFAAALDGS